MLQWHSLPQFLFQVRRIFVEVALQPAAGPMMSLRCLRQLQAFIPKNRSRNRLEELVFHIIVAALLSPFGNGSGYRPSERLPQASCGCIAEGLNRVTAAFSREVMWSRPGAMGISNQVYEGATWCDK